MDCGNASAAAQQNVSGTWNSSYKGVFHPKDGVTLNGVDSVTQAAGSAVGATTAAAGNIGGAANFGTSMGYMGYSGSTLSSLDNSNKTFTLWLKSAATGPGTTNGLFDKDNAVSGWGVYFHQNGSVRNPRLWIQGGKDLDPTGSLSVPANLWIHVAVSWDATAKAATFYINGVQNGAPTVNTTITELASGTQPMVIGSFRTGGACPLNGTIDEVHAFDTVVPAAWIKAEFDNQNAPSSFYAMAPQE